MPLTPQMQLVLAGLYWLIALPIAVFILRQTIALFGEGMPSWPRGFSMVLLIAPVAYLVFDLSGYVILRAMQDTLVHLPPGYSYFHWFREPLALKWQVLSLLPGVRYLPIAFAICAAGVLQVFFLEEVPFRKGLVILTVQWLLTLVAFYLLSLAFGWGIGWFGKTFEHEMPRLSAATTEATDVATIHVKEEMAHAGSLVTLVVNFLKSGGWLVVLVAAAFVIAVVWVMRTLRRLFRAVTGTGKRRHAH